MCLMQTDFPVPDGPRIIEIWSFGRPRFRPLRIGVAAERLLDVDELDGVGGAVLAGAPAVPLVGVLALARLLADVVGHLLVADGARAGCRSCGGPAARPPRRLLPVARVERPLPSAPPLSLLAQASLLVLRQPPIGALGFDPQKICVPTIPTTWTSTVFSTIDFAVAVPTPTGPPRRVVSVITPHQHDHGGHGHALNEAVKKVGWVLEHPEDQEEAAGARPRRSAGPPPGSWRRSPPPRPRCT